MSWVTIISSTQSVMYYIDLAQLLLARHSIRVLKCIRPAAVGARLQDGARHLSSFFRHSLRCTSHSSVLIWTRL